MPRTREQPPPPPDRTTYAVTYAVAGEPGVRRAEVTVVPGYSQESDIPRLLAARLTGRPGDARRIVLLALREPGAAARRPRRRTGHRRVSPA